MLGLMYIGGALLYLILMFVVVQSAWRMGRRNGGSIWKGVGFALIGFLLVYLPAFWNLIPTAIAHKKACGHDAGFQAFIDPKGWIASHQVQISTLRGIDPDATSKSRKTSSGFYRYTYMGGLLAKDERSTKQEISGLALGRFETRIVDIETDQVLAQTVDYSLGSREDARVWLTRRSCFPDDVHPLSKLSAFNQQLREALQ